MKQINKKILTILIIAFLATFIGYTYGKKRAYDNNWQVVKLTNGNIYYGHLKSFPRYKLTDAYFLQQKKENEEEQNSIQLSPVSSMYFGPENTIYLNRDQVIWWSNLSKSSQILKLIER